MNAVKQLLIFFILSLSINSIHAYALNNVGSTKNNFQEIFFTDEIGELLPIRKKMDSFDCIGTKYLVIKSRVNEISEKKLSVKWFLANGDVTWTYTPFKSLENETLTQWFGIKTKKSEGSFSFGFLNSSDGLEQLVGEGLVEVYSEDGFEFKKKFTVIC